MVLFSFEYNRHKNEVAGAGDVNDEVLLLIKLTSKCGVVGFYHTQTIRLILKSMTDTCRFKEVKK